MRGLVQFIADLRNARARELEEKRINKELANIRFVLPLARLCRRWVTDWCDRPQTKIQRYGTALRRDAADRLLITKHADGNLSGYHKKKYVCKVSAISYFAHSSLTGYSFYIYTYLGGTSILAISKLSI